MRFEYTCHMRFVLGTDVYFARVFYRVVRVHASAGLQINVCCLRACGRRPVDFSRFFFYYCFKLSSDLTDTARRNGTNKIHTCSQAYTFKREDNSEKKTKR